MTITLERVARLEIASPVAAGVDEALALARRLGETTFLSHSEPLAAAANPLTFLAASSAALGGGVLWSPSGNGASFAGAGSALDFRGDGPGRFGAVSRGINSLRQRLIRTEERAPFPIVGGFAFDDETTDSPQWRDFPDASLTVPRVLLQASEGVSLLRVTVPVAPTSPPDGVEFEIESLLARARRWSRISELALESSPTSIVRSIPSRAAWESSVATTVAMIRRGMLEKVVLAREERLQVQAGAAFSPVSVLARLRSADPAATLFAIQSGQSWFIGATPERLVRLDRGQVDVTCLAGSIGSGATPDEREMLAERLLASEKDRHEHEIVVGSTMAALAEVCDRVHRLAGTPRVTVARSVQHLETPISAHLVDVGQVLDLVARLHPTPAVGGYPRDRAMRVIRELEAIDRGWYAGPFGWTDLDGSGEFSVAIRSALLRGSNASLFAGCGIVADSVPADEYAETCLKLRPMLAALGVV